MISEASLRISEEHYLTLMAHLFPGDKDEHGAVLLAGMQEDEKGLTLLVREVHCAKEGTDYVAGKIGHRALSPSFIHRMITRARDNKLVYLAAHNHLSDRSVDFSYIDLESHERGYPALLQITRGVPVGALVFGLRSIQMDLWLNHERRVALKEAIIIGNTISRLRPSPIHDEPLKQREMYDRQIKMFGGLGQVFLKQSRVGIVGLGGVGSILAEYLARLGVGNFCLIDADRVEESNLSRIIGAKVSDAETKELKVLVARRNILQANKDASIEVIADDVCKTEASQSLKTCDYIFLAADSMRARLIVNAIVHQYLIPAVQLGSKIRSHKDSGLLIDVMSAKRPIRPGKGCLWCNGLIDPNQLAIESKTDEERKAQAYGVEEGNPSVITLNAISAGHAANDFLLDYLNLRSSGELAYEHHHFLTGKRMLVSPRKDPKCTECGNEGYRYAMGDLVDLPTIN